MDSKDMSKEELKRFIKAGLIYELNRKNYNENEEEYVKPEFKPLSQDQIDEIHKRGRITPEEIVKEWEDFGLCAPGDSGFNERCHNFKNCHDCLVDYANMKNDYMSILKITKEYFSKHILSENIEEIKESVLTKHK